MRVVSISDNDVYGHRFNGFELSADLRSRGHTADCLVWTKYSADPHTHVIASQHPQRIAINQLACALQDAYSTQAIFAPFSYDILFHPAFLSADVVHLHLIHNSFFSILHLPILARLKPIVWTLHDPWALTGHCVHPFSCERWKTGCGACPALDAVFPVKHDATALNAEIKRMAFAQSDVDIVVASEWMERRVRVSPILQSARVHRVPFGVDGSVFRPTEQLESRRQLGIPAHGVVFGLRAIEGQFKGLDTVRAALRRVPSSLRITLVTFNNTGLLDEFRGRFPIVELGWVYEDARMACAYNAIDVFLMPSAADSFGMMAMEAMACGTPSIVTAGTALEETVRPELGAGIVIPGGDAERLAQEIAGLANDPERRRALGQRAYDTASRYYTKERYIGGIIDVYRFAIERRLQDGCVDRILDELRACPVSKLSVNNEGVRGLGVDSRSLLNRVRRLLTRKPSARRLRRFWSSRNAILGRQR